MDAFINIIINVFTIGYFENIEHVSTTPTSETILILLVCGFLWYIGILVIRYLFE